VKKLELIKIIKEELRQVIVEQDSKFLPWQEVAKQAVKLRHVKQLLSNAKKKDIISPIAPLSGVYGLLLTRYRLFDKILGSIVEWETDYSTGYGKKASFRLAKQQSLIKDPTNIQLFHEYLEQYFGKDGDLVYDSQSKEYKTAGTPFTLKKR